MQVAKSGWLVAVRNHGSARHRVRGYGRRLARPNKQPLARRINTRRLPTRAASDDGAQRDRQCGKTDSSCAIRRHQAEAFHAVVCAY